MGENWGSRKRRHGGTLRSATLAAVAAGAMLIAVAGCTVAPPVTGTANLPDGPGTISIDQGPIGPKGFCLPYVFALSYVAQDTPTAFVLKITASPSMCETVNPVAAIYAMPKGATNLGNAFPQKLAERTPFTIKGPGVTTITFHKGCLPAQFDVVTGDTPPVIYPGGPYHGPQLFPFPWAAGAAGLWYGSDCSGGGGCGSYTPTNLAVEPSSIAPGGSVTVSGSGTPGTTITISFRQPPAAPVPSGASVKVPADGHWSTPVTVPSSLTPGKWQVVAGVQGCEVAATADLTITGGTPPTPSNPPTPSVPSNVASVTTIVAGISDPGASVAGESTTNNSGASGTSGTGLAFTGSTVRIPVVAGILLLVAGTLLLLQRRRRHS